MKTEAEAIKLRMIFRSWIKDGLPTRQASPYGHLINDMDTIRDVLRRAILELGGRPP